MKERSLQEAGRQLTRGALIEVGIVALFVSIIGPIGTAAINLVLVRSGIGLDDSDDPQGRRSGVRVRTDYGTGCQYLESRAGALTPRNGKDRKQMCR